MLSRRMSPASMVENDKLTKGFFVEFAYGFDILIIVTFCGIHFRSVYVLASYPDAQMLLYLVQSLAIRPSS